MNKATIAVSVRPQVANLTQHSATDEQKLAGVYDLPASQQASLKTLLTFDDVPSREEMKTRASKIADLICVHEIEGADDMSVRQLHAAEKALTPDAAMVGGAPFFMRHLEDALHARGIEVVYAFSKRESVDVPQEDGTVRKTAIFRHVGFVQTETVNPSQETLAGMVQEVRDAAQDPESRLEVSDLLNGTWIREEDFAEALVQANEESPIVGVVGKHGEYALSHSCSLRTNAVAVVHIADCLSGYIADECYGLKQLLK